MSELDPNPERSRPFSAADPRATPEDELICLVQTAKIPNGLLFTGAQGTGKSKAALFLAKACNCGQGTAIPCERCGSCRKLNAGMHPDYIAIDLEEGKKNISISQIRDMSRLMSARPNEAAHRVVFIRNAHRMNIQAQNAMLKVLEEPPEQTFFILSAEDAAALLPTILSRCRKIRFRPPSPGQIRLILEQTHGMTPRTAHIAAHTLGAVDLVLDCLSGPSAEDSAWMRTRCWLISRVLEIISDRGPSLKSLALARHLAQAPDQIQLRLAVIRTVLRDLAVFRHSPEKIVNLDFFSAFEDISQMHSESKILEWTSSFHEFEKRLEANCGLRLALDRFFLTLSSCADAPASA